MAETYKGIVKKGVVTLPKGVHLPDGLEVVVVVMPPSSESPEDLAWEALSAEAWEQDWVEGNKDLTEGK